MPAGRAGQAWSARLAQECKDALELVIAPAWVALLPWRLAYRLMRWSTRFLPLYEAPARQALAEYAARFAPQPDAATWLRLRKLVTWIDHADHYLGNTRSNRWMGRHLRVQGQWPAPGSAALLLTFHWGAGMWGLRHAAQAGLAPHALVASTEGEPFRGRTVLGWYARARTATVKRALGAEPLDVGRSLRPAIKALKAGGQVLAAVDVPSDQASSAENIELLGLPMAVPRALHRLAVEQKVPVYVYITGIDIATGQRTLDILNLGIHEDVRGLVLAVFAELEKTIREQPAAWHFWGESARFFRHQVTDKR